MEDREVHIVPFHDPDAWGFIPTFISVTEVITKGTPMWEMIDRSYAHGGGWNDFEGFDVSQDEDGKYTLQYRGDPPYHEIDRIEVEDQILVLFPYAWVMWVRGDETKIARID